jgi:cytochrome c peroxidase
MQQLRFGTRSVLIAVVFIASSGWLALSSFKRQSDPFQDIYFNSLEQSENTVEELLHKIKETDISVEENKAAILEGIYKCRSQIKQAEVWLRYLDPVGYRRINGPLPVEWETEVFEKFEKPYRRPGSGLTLAENYLGESSVNKDSLYTLVNSALIGLEGFRADSCTRQLQKPGHFFLANRLHLLNLAAIYTTGFECPNRTRILPELGAMLETMLRHYQYYNVTYPIKFSDKYLGLYQNMLDFVKRFEGDIEAFDHFIFLRDFVNPLYELNAKMLRENNIISTSFVDYSLNRSVNFIFDKNLYKAQNTAGIYSGIKDPTIIDEITELGRLLFYDPILSGNLSRSCGSCHKPDQCFTDTTAATALAYDGVSRLNRNAPSLVLAAQNHLVMQDGAHFNLQSQAMAVISNPQEMHGDPKRVMKYVLSCEKYRQQLKKFSRYTPLHPKPNAEHVLSALTMYYASAGKAISGFDSMMLGFAKPAVESTRGFNLFMGKAQCATCHFVPHFNGVKPPYTGSEFEVIGTPDDRRITALSKDSGRFKQHPAEEMLHAFRTPGLRNISKTAPYMHNGVFRSLDEVMRFYNHGGGVGNLLQVENQTLAADSLNLSDSEISDIIAFLQSLDEKIPETSVPASLPRSGIKKLNARKPGGIY